ncbi:MAG: 1-deoxy-D-xylulose-5-phosphate reductoisomerase, partial [Actinobacteria bacterium]|nr:1-deoxy-D-xylulose-5-phosphate reductoisomerase [Actinomycetota bacterium]
MSQLRVAIAGSTGSIGRQTLEVIKAHSDDYVVTALAVGSAVDLVVEQA